MYIDFIKRILQNNLEKRVGETESIATDILLEYLQKNVTKDVLIQEFGNKVPLESAATLYINNKKIECESISFFSGEFDDSTVLTDFDFEQSIDNSYIAFNKNCPEISLHTYFAKPSVAISAKSAEPFYGKTNLKIEGSVDVDIFSYTSRNLIVGNLTNPINIFFCHLDTVKNGFIDNLSGVLAALELLKIDLSLLQNSLFVFSGNEELSYEFPTYWGIGYRKFEEKYSSILESCRQIYVLDCIGQTPFVFYTDPAIVPLGFPAKNLQKFIDKTVLVAGDLDSLMEIYHSTLDTQEKFVKKHFDGAIAKVLQDIEKYN